MRGLSSGTQRQRHPSQSLLILDQNQQETAPLCARRIDALLHLGRCRHWETIDIQDQRARLDSVIGRDAVFHHRPDRGTGLRRHQAELASEAISYLPEDQAEIVAGDPRRRRGR